MKYLAIVSKVVIDKEKESVKNLAERKISISEIENLAETEIIDLFDMNADY